MGKQKERNFGDTRETKEFIAFVRRLGLTVTQSPAIHCATPVLDKNGRQKKTITAPDCYVIDPLTNQGTHVEVTSGTGTWGSKDSQLRVVRQAEKEMGVEIPYCVVCGPDMHSLRTLEDSSAVREKLFDLFGWSFPGETTSEGRE